MDSNFIFQMRSYFKIIFAILMAITTVKGNSYLLVILYTCTLYTLAMLILKTVNCLLTDCWKNWIYTENCFGQFRRCYRTKTALGFSKNGTNE